MTMIETANNGNTYFDKAATTWDDRKDMNDASRLAFETLFERYSEMSNIGWRKTSGPGSNDVLAGK